MKTMCLVLLFGVLLGYTCVGQSTSRVIVENEAAAIGLNLRSDCASMIAQDVWNLDQIYRGNQLADREIDSLVRAYTMEILNEFQKSPAWRSRSFGEADYDSVRSNFFYQVVTLDISSEPVGAKVQVKEPLIDLGNTSISKPFQSQIEYVFVFQLDGYATTEKKFMVARYPRKQKLQVSLTSQ